MFRDNEDVDDVCDEDPVLCLLFPSLDPTSLLAGDIDIAEFGVACGEFRPVPGELSESSTNSGDKLPSWHSGDESASSGSSSSSSP